MACMEHICRNRHCDFVAMNNDPRPPARCPDCGGSDFASHFDEPFTDYTKENNDE